MLKPMAVAAMGGLSLGIFVALFLLPCLYLVFTREKATSPEAFQPCIPEKATLREATAERF
ncbi:hypothetical protein [Desulfococcus sp.]|uniref:hypothetical protein n=1 Tax=Desulfococcus sp. TaxID=2025834 RepID=UPI0035940453